MSQDLDRLHSEAEGAVRAGNLAHAEQLCQQILSEREDFRAALLLATIIAKQGDAQHAISALFRAAAIPTGVVEPFDAVGLVFRLFNSTGELFGLCQQAITSSQADSAGYYFLGVCLSLGQQMDQALAMFKRAIELNPRSARAHFGLAQVLVAKRHLADAIVELKQAVLLDSKDPYIQIRLASIFMAMSHTEQAEACLLKAIELNPNLADAHIHLGHVRGLAGKTSDAVASLERAIELEPRNPFPYLQLGLRLQELGRFEESEAKFKQAIGMEPRLGQAYYGLVSVRKVGEEDKPLVDQMREVLDRGGLLPLDQRHIHYALAKALDDLGLTGDAMKAFDEAHLLAQRYPMPNEGIFQPEKHHSTINLLVQRFTNDSFERLKEVGSSSELPLFVVGLPRSGTTLLEQILTRHPRIGTAGELTYWFKNEDALSTNLANAKPDVNAARRMASEYLSILKEKAPGKERVIDKRNTNFMDLGQLHVLFPRAKIIHCRRNPLDNCLSLYTTLFRGYAPPFTHSRDHLLAYYREYDRLMAHWLSVLPSEQVFEVRYEDLVSDTEKWVREIVAFCGLSWNEACLDHEKNERVVLTPSLWQVRQPIYKSSVERWRKYEPWLGVLKSLSPEK